jgi:group I intron endonuclease
MEQLGCIYYISCKETGKGYVGQTKYPSPEIRYKEHWNSVGRKCNLFLHKAMRKYGREAFTVERLCVVPHEALGRMEEYWAEQLQTYMWDDTGYNMVWCGGTGSLGVKMSEEAKEKIRIAQTGRKHSEETKNKIRQANLRKKVSDETKEKLRQSKLNISDETRQKIGQASLGRHPSDETRRKMSEVHSNISDETRQKIGQAALGRIISEETRKKISEAARKKREAKAALLPSNVMANV